jgi:hypothetical protein
MAIKYGYNTKNTLIVTNVSYNLGSEHDLPSSAQLYREESGYSESTQVQGK